VASPPSTTPRSQPAEAGGYFAWSRDPAVALLGVLPLWLLYELLRLSLAPAERNGAEALVTDSLQLAGPGALGVLKVVLGLCVLAAAVSVMRRDLPWLSLVGVSALEGAVYGLMLGPVTQALTFFVLEGRALQGGIGPDLVGSLGAGIFEEAVFRLGILSLLSLLLVRACLAFGLPRLLGVFAAVLISSLAFAWFHHVGAGGEPYELRIFTFRSVAGMVLGTLFVFRGFAVVVYAHAAYDLHFYLTHA
jgi:membrane protease YdiL (CAAX protease family)